MRIDGVAAKEQALACEPQAQGVGRVAGRVQDDEHVVVRVRVAVFGTERDALLVGEPSRDRVWLKLAAADLGSERRVAIRVESRRGEFAVEAAGGNVVPGYSTKSCVAAHVIKMAVCVDDEEWQCSRGGVVEFDGKPPPQPLVISIRPARSHSRVDEDDPAASDDHIHERVLIESIVLDHKVHARRELLDAHKRALARTEGPASRCCHAG